MLPGKSPKGITRGDDMSAGGGWCDRNHRRCRISRSNSRGGAGIDWCDWLVGR
jgi:hypothetical protein